MRGQRDTPSPGLGICQFRLSYFRVAVNSRSAFPFPSETAVDGEIRSIETPFTGILERVDISGWIIKVKDIFSQPLGNKMANADGRKCMEF